jgi:hypothetical protein
LDEIMLPEDAAVDLAARLNALGAGAFRAKADRVVRAGSKSAFAPLRLVGAGKGRPYEVEHALAETAGERVMLYSNRFWPGGLGLLERAHANYMDRTRLHVGLTSPEFFVHVVDEYEVVPLVEEAPRLDLGGAAAVVALAMLEDPGGVFRVTEVANATHAAPATAQRVFHGLEAEGLLIAEGRGPQKVRRLADASGADLLERYANDARRDRRRSIRLRVLGDSSEDVIGAVAEGLEKARILSCLTGAAAAALEAPALTSGGVPEFWVSGSKSPESIAQAAGGVPSGEGANVILWRAGSRGPTYATRVIHGMRRASPFRVYADLLANPQRGREQAAYYREQVIGF